MELQSSNKNIEFTSFDAFLENEEKQEIPVIKNWKSSLNLELNTLPSYLFL